MPRILTENELKEAITHETFIKNGKPENVEGLKYDFRMGSQILKAERGPIETSRLAENLRVEPGEVVFVLTEESLDLPKNIIANLSHKRKISHDGILVLGGLCIDPLYQGRLLCGLYNFSATPYTLIPGKKLIAAVFYELQQQELSDFKRPQTTIKDFPEDLIRLMQQYKPISILALDKQLKKIELELDNLRRDFRNQEDWFKKFQQGLDQLLHGLENETHERKEAEKELRTDLKGVYWSAAKLSAGVGAVGALIISILVALFLFVIQKWATN